jgi:hypothetical protein
MGKDKLQLPLHSEWVRYCWDSDAPRALQAFRGSYKTTAVGVVGAVRWMLFHPDDRIAIIRKNYHAAADVARTIASAMDREEIKALFQGVYGVIPKTKTRKEGSLAYSFKTTNTPEGNITALGLESSITGRHFDKILCDDIITIKDRASPAERRRTADMVRELAANIIDPGKGSIWIGTPWHRDDAWKVINTFCDIAKYPISRYNFLCDEAVKQKREHTIPYLYAANYELELLSDESLLFHEPKWQTFNAEAYKRTRVYGHLDAAYGGTDACALTFIAGNRIAGFLYPGRVKD